VALAPGRRNAVRGRRELRRLVCRAQRLPGGLFRPTTAIGAGSWGVYPPAISSAEMGVDFGPAAVRACGCAAGHRARPYIERILQSCLRAAPRRRCLRIARLTVDRLEFSQSRTPRSPPRWLARSRSCRRASKLMWVGFASEFREGVEPLRTYGAGLERARRNRTRVTGSTR